MEKMKETTRYKSIVLKRLFKGAGLGFLALNFFGCAALMENRTFIDQMDHQTDNVFIPGEDFDYVPGDSGVPHRTREEIAMRTPASSFESHHRQESSSLYKELSYRERKLTMKERELYNEVQSQFEGPSEKIYYLTLSPAERREYLDVKRIDYGGGSYPSYGRASRGLASLQPIYQSSLQLGMSKDQVIGVWGRPARVEVAGNPRNENERWAFYDNGRVKYVYFEGGAVQGWNVQ